MDTVYIFLQHYWWFIVSLLGALLVFLLFVQGGQGMLYVIGRSDSERNLIVNSLGRKWELTFTTLVTFGGAFFASFPLFYSTSFGGAFYVWMLILLVFVLQAVAYEYRRKPSNLLGEKTYNWFLLINGVLGTFLLGTAVATLFTGAPLWSTRPISRITKDLIPYRVGPPLGTDWMHCPIPATSCSDCLYCSCREFWGCSTS